VSLKPISIGRLMVLLGVPAPRVVIGRNPLVGKIYYLTPEWKVKNVVGEIRFNRSTGAFSGSCSKLDEFIPYAIGYTDAPNGKFTQFTYLVPHDPASSPGVRPNRTGDLKFSGIDPYPPTLLSAVEQGGFFIVTPMETKGSTIKTLMKI
jgi:hypothetical protein